MAPWNNVPQSTTQAGAVHPRGEPCDLCAATEFELVASLDRHGEPLDTVVCRDCGLVSHGRLPTDDELARYYAAEYRQSYHHEDRPSATRVLRDCWSGERLYQRLAPFIGPTDAVFEIGAGVGGNILPYHMAGHATAGIEPGEGFQRFAADELGLRVERKLLADLPAVPAYDLVLLVHVIEHFGSPSAALRHIRTLLRPGGKLYVECPNLGGPHAPPSQLFHFAHIHNFTERTLTHLARACGFEVTARLHDGDDRNLALLLAPAETIPAAADPAAYFHTLDSLRRYNDVTYYLRASYLARRAASLADYLWARWLGETEVQCLLARCRSRTADSPHHPTFAAPPLRHAA